MAVLLQYNFTTDLLPTTIAAGVSGSQATNSSLVAMALASLGYSSDPILNTNPTAASTTAAQAITNNSYFYVNITPTSGNTMSLTTLTFNIARGGASTPRGYDVRSSANAFATTLGTADVATARPTFTAVSIDLSAAAYQTVSGTLTFRIYLYAPSENVQMDLDTIVINGSTTAGGTVEQEGFIFYNDNAGEASSSGLAAQDTNVVREKSTNTRLRVLLNSTLDRGAETYQLEFRRVNDAAWNVIA